MQNVHQRNCTLHGVVFNEKLRHPSPSLLATGAAEADDDGFDPVVEHKAFGCGQEHLGLEGNGRLEPVSDQGMAIRAADTARPSISSTL